MKIVTTTSVYPPCTDMAQIIHRLAALGFDGMDIAFDYCVQDKTYPFMTDGYEDWAGFLRMEAEASGIFFTHGHAPFDASGRGDIVERTLRCASLLGVRYVVVHPLWRKADGSFYEDPAEFISVNKEAIQPILAAAEKHGVVILSENLLWGASIPAENIADLVKAVDSPQFGWCYDTGHANAFGRSYDALKDVSHVPVSLHIQDNHANGRDDHLIPGDGNIDWYGFMKVLKSIGYPGEFVIEAHHQTLEMEDDKRDPFLAELLRRARELNAFYEGL